MRKHILVYAVTSMSLVIGTLLAAWLLLGFDTSVLGLHGWIAMLLGIVLTTALAVALMAAVFASDSQGFDSGGSGRQDRNE